MQLAPSRIHVPSTGLAELLSVSSLRRLDLSECLHVSGTEVVKGLTGSCAARAQLETLSLKGCTYIRVRQLMWFCMCLHVCVCARRTTRRKRHSSPSSLQDLAVFSLTQLLGYSLRELDLTSCVNVTDLSVRAIATYLPKLVVLRLGWCKEVTDWGLLGIVETTKCDPDQETVSSTDL